MLLLKRKRWGKNLAGAYKQAVFYFPRLSDDELPRYVLVSDFWQFERKDLPRKIHLFHFISGC